MNARPQIELLIAPGGMEMFASDTTVRVAGDVRLVDLQKKLAESNQWLAIDGDENRTIAELVECNSTGPLRLGFGGWRDILLGCQFTNHAHELITAGGRAVKNVAGYDLTKLMVGQRGQLGKIQNITARTYQLPVGSLLLTMPCSPIAVRQFITGSVRAQWLIQTFDKLYAGLLGDQSTLDYFAREAGGFVGVESSRISLAKDTQFRAELFQWPGRTGRTGSFRASVPPMKILEFVQTAGIGSENQISHWAADPAFGIVVGYSDDHEKLRAAAKDVGGSLSELTPDYRHIKLLQNLTAAFGKNGGPA